MLKLAGVDVNNTRAASTSKATVSGLSLCEILERGCWSNASTWQRFYKKRHSHNSSKFSEQHFHET